MVKFIFYFFLPLFIFPISLAFSQVSDLNTTTLSVVLTNDSPFIYKDSEGFTVVVGAVANTNSLSSFTNVKIVANFYDDYGVEPLETVEGGPILQVIPPLGESPYMLKSKTSNSNITQVSVAVLGFDSSTSKSQEVSIQIKDVVLDDTLHFSGVFNNGPAPIANANVFIAFYDVFQPPRIIGIETIPIGDLEPSEKINFSFDKKIESRAAGFKVFSESNIFYSNPIDIKIPEPKKQIKFISISNVMLTDTLGEKLSEIQVGSTVKIQSESTLFFSEDEPSKETPYTYYVQIKQSGIPFVEFLGKYEGRYIGGGIQTQSVDWIPENKGLYFVETFVWDRNKIPLADKGPVILVLVN